MKAREANASSMEPLASLLRVRRGSASLREFGEVVGVSAPTLSRLENGATPDVPTLLHLCRALSLSADLALGLSPLADEGVALLREVTRLHRLLSRLRALLMEEEEEPRSPP